MPVVIEVILERVTNIAMGTEIDTINEFEELDCRQRRRRADGSIAAGNARLIPTEHRDTMPRFAANLTMLFTEVPFLDRFERRRQGRLRGRRVPVPLRLRRRRRSGAPRCDANGLKLVLHNLPAGDWDAGERGIACHPGPRRRVPRRRRQGHRLRDRARRAAAQLPGRQGAAGRERRTRLRADPGRATCASPPSELKSAGIRLLIEPINTYDIPGFFLNRTDQALALIDEVGATNLFLQYDIYHAQRMEGELGATIAKHLARIGHIQLADNPGRNEPGTGEINYPFLFEHLDRARLHRLDRLRIQAGDAPPRRPGLAHRARAMTPARHDIKELDA